MTVEGGMPGESTRRGANFAPRPARTRHSQARSLIELADARELISELFGEPVRNGRCRAVWVGGDGPSVQVSRDGAYHHAQGKWYGILDLVQLGTGLDRPGAIKWLAARYGAGAGLQMQAADRWPPQSFPHERLKTERSQAKNQQIKRALALWQEAEPIGRDSLTAEYLRSRGLDPSDITHAIRHHPRCPFGEERPACMVALMRDVETDEPCGIQRTALDSTGRKISRKMLGVARRAAVKLTEDADVLTGLGVAEGIETALTVVQRFGWRPVWALLSAGNIKQFPVLEGIEYLTVWADADSAGVPSARAAAKRWATAGFEVTIRHPAAEGLDYNDLGAHHAS